MGRSSAEREPGDYYGPVFGFNGKDAEDCEIRAIYFNLPVRREDGSVICGHICIPPHDYQENPDGSIMVIGSIKTRWGDEPGQEWHGHLIQGVWTECK